MKVNVRDILSEGLRLKIAEDGPELQVVAGEMGSLIIPPVSADLWFLRSDGDIFVRGSMNALLKLQCSRCLKEFEHKVNSTIDIVYNTMEAPSAVKEKELTQEEGNTQYLAGDEIDINGVLVEQLSLDMPTQPVCSESCKGLCPKCGRDLNQGKKCSCPDTGHVDSRFAKLKELKLK
jgi:uncharacterized protein